MRKHLGKIIIFISIIVMIFAIIISNKSNNSQQAEEKLPLIKMLVKYEPSGTQISKDGYLKIRMDLYPTVGNKTYDSHHIQVPVIPTEGYLGKVDKFKNPVDENDYDKWIKELPKTWKVNPILSHFIKVNPNITSMELEIIVKQIFDKDTLMQLDELLSQPKTDLDKISLLMGSKGGSGKKLPAATDIKNIKEQLKTRLSGFETNVGQ